MPKINQKNLFLLKVAAILVVVFIAVPAIAATQKKRATKFAPFTMTTFKGEKLDLTTLNGFPMVVNFWGSWCHPCRQEAPALEKTYNLYKSRGVEFVGVAVGDVEKDARAFIDYYGLTYSNGMDVGDAIADQHEAFVLPMTLVVDKDGYIIYRHFGVVKVNTLSRALEMVLKDGK